MAKAGYLQSVALDFKLGFPSGTRTRDLRVSSPALFQPAVTTPTDWAKSLRLGSFSSGWTVALFRNPDKRERWKTAEQNEKHTVKLAMATMTLCNAVFMLMLLAALSTCHGNAFGAWSGKQRQRKKKLAIYRSWPWISNCWLWDSNSGLSGIEPRALTTRPRRLGANLRRDATSRLLFLNQSVLADFDPRKKKKSAF